MLTVSSYELRVSCPNRSGLTQKKEPFRTHLPYNGFSFHHPWLICPRGAHAGDWIRGAGHACGLIMWKYTYNVARFVMNVRSGSDPERLLLSSDLPTENVLAQVNCSRVQLDAGWVLPTWCKCNIYLKEFDQHLGTEVCKHICVKYSYQWIVKIWRTRGVHCTKHAWVYVSAQKGY